MPGWFSTWTDRKHAALETAIAHAEAAAPCEGSTLLAALNEAKEAARRGRGEVDAKREAEEKVRREAEEKARREAVERSAREAAEARAAAKARREAEEKAAAEKNPTFEEWGPGDPHNGCKVTDGGRRVTGTYRSSTESETSWSSATTVALGHNDATASFVVDYNGASAMIGVLRPGADRAIELAIRRVSDWKSYPDWNSGAADRKW